MKRFFVTVFCSMLALIALGAGPPRLVIQGGRAGFVDDAGRLLAPPRHARLGRWSEGRIWVQALDEPGAPGTFLDETGKPVSRTRFRDLSSIRPELPMPEFRLGVATVGLADGGFGYVDTNGVLLARTTPAGAFQRQTGDLLMHAEDGRIGFIDRNGVTRIPARFDDAHPFYVGRAGVAEAGWWGVIDEAGEWIARPAFDEIWSLSTDPPLWRYRQGEKWGLLGRGGARLTEARFDDFGLVRGDAASVRLGDRWGLVSVSGGLFFEPRHTWLQPFGDEEALWAAQSASGHWGVVSTNGRECVSAVFDRVKELAPGVWTGAQAGEIGLLNPTNGQWRSGRRYSSLVALPDPFRPLAWAMQKGRRGGVDLVTEEVRVPLRYSHVRLWGALLACQEGRQMRLHDKTGWVVQEWKGRMDGLPPFENLRDGVGVLRATPSGTSAFYPVGGTLIRADGTLPLSVWFEAVGPWSAGLLAARHEGRWGLVDLEGRWVVEPRFEGMGACSGVVTPAAEGGRWGLIDFEGRWVVEPAFEAVGEAWNGLFPARRGEGWGLIDATGAEVLSCVYDGLEWGAEEAGGSRFHGAVPDLIPGLDGYGR